MSQRAQHIRLGLFLVLFVVVLAGGLVALAGTRLWEQREHFSVRFDESVAGLEVGAPVKVNGVRVGRVDTIELDERDISRVIVTISMQGHVPIRRDAEALVQLQGITGLRYIEVNPGTRGQPELEPGSEIRAGASDIGLWTGRAEDIYAQLQQLIARVMRLASDENLANVETILEEASRLMVRAAQLAAQLNDVVRENRTEIQGAVTEFRRAGGAVASAGEELTTTSRVIREDMGTTLAAGRRALGRYEQLAESGTRALDSAGGLVDDARREITAERIGQVMETLVVALQALSQAATSLQTMLDRGETDIGQTLEAVRAAAEQLEDFSRTLRDNPGALLRSGGMPEEEVPR
jgi:phospholipid/cholesterol/gamma-HCH transport system substrate-binding protein